MCMYCERRTDVKFGWEQPKLPYHNNMPFRRRLCTIYKVHELKPKKNRPQEKIFPVVFCVK